MFFGKEERKARHPYLVLTVGALAAIGAMSIISGCKCRIRSVVRGITCRGKGDAEAD